MAVCSLSRAILAGLVERRVAEDVAVVRVEAMVDQKSQHRRVIDCFE
jgi:hypothetical protein